MVIPTTLNDIRRHRPCKDGREKLLKHLGKTKADDDPLLISTILASNGLAAAIWCLRAFGDKQAIAEFARRCADSVKHLSGNSLAAVAAAAAYADDAAAAAAADAAADAAAAAADAAAAAAAADAADAARAAAAYAAAYAAADAAYGAERKKQEQFLIEIFG